MKNLQFIFNLAAGFIITALGAILSMIDPAGTSLALVGFSLVALSLITKPKTLQYTNTHLSSTKVSSTKPLPTMETS